MRCARYWAWFVAVTILALLAPMAARGQGDAQVPEVVAHIFWQPGCPHCTRAKEALGGIVQRVAGMQVNEIELGASPERAGRPNASKIQPARKLPEFGGRGWFMLTAASDG